MVVLIRKTHLGLSALLLAAVAGMALILWQGSGSITTFSSLTGGEPSPIVVVDPGHGGEDGGAVAADGTVESGLNLQIAQRLNDLLRFLGQVTVMTRTEDVSIYSDGAETLHQKKVSDLKNRVALVNGLEDAVLVSIHQNSLPGSPKTHGAQVFYNGLEPAPALAATVQERLNQSINTGNGKTPKRISDSIYLTKNVTAPAIIVECGFLSNGEDTAHLQEPGYQLQLAVAVAAGYLSTEETP
ncbi:putative N-acetylmuramoyl-L-alanine amidase [Oscillibacter valericigenes Sjm18-20]|nr:putative N-acetylmuramoyl-L-alanine amidase [Oscillibacter valericigenes Sjm18-20]